MIEQLLKELGLEFEQTFSVGGMNRYKFTENGLLSKDGYNDLILREMIYGKITKKDIKLMPWEPEYGENYFTVSFESNVALKLTWSNDTTDFNLYNNGLVCKTKEEAEQLMKCMLEAVCTKNQN